MTGFRYILYCMYISYSDLPGSLGLVFFNGTYNLGEFNLHQSVVSPRYRIIVHKLMEILSLL